MLWITIKHVQCLLTRNISKLSATICSYWGKHKLHHFKSLFQTFWGKSIFSDASSHVVLLWLFSISQKNDSL